MTNTDIDTGGLIKGLRALMSEILGAKVSWADIGYLIGYQGDNVYLTIKRLRDGEKAMSGPALMRALDLAYALGLWKQSHLLVSEWHIKIRANEDEEPGGEYIIEHTWFPRFTLVAGSDLNGVHAMDGLGFQPIGAIREQDWFDDELLTVMIHYQDILSKPQLMAPFLEEGFDHLKAAIAETCVK